MPLRPTARPAVESMYRFVLWLVPTVEKFPRRQKFLLGARLGKLIWSGVLGADHRQRGLFSRRCKRSG